MILGLFLTVVLFSCVSIRTNFLGSDFGALNDTILSAVPSEKQKILLQVRADSLLKVITEQKRKNKHLLGREINQLYAGFGEQQNNDRYYQYLLNKKPFKKDSLSYDQYLAALELMTSAANYDKSYQKDRFVRRTINRGDTGNNIPKNILQKSRNYLYSHSVRRTLENNFTKYYNATTDSLFKLLPATSPTKAFSNRVFRNNDLFHSFIYSFVYDGSYIVGNTIGLFYKKTDREKNAKLLGPELRPFDIVVMKSPHHLTDQFIPGYFGHVGIWLGNDLASKLTHKPAKDDESKGRSMVEVLRSGVKISTLREFCDGDIFLIIRPTRLIENQKKTILVNVSKQLKKDYDFNFDIESPESITCTELVYLTYDFIDWQIRYTWSRYTLSPDDLVQTALHSNDFEFPFYLKNEAVVNEPDSTFVQSLIGEEKSQ